jgi:hypothetical protein
LWSQRRRFWITLIFIFLPHFHKEEDVEKVHPSENQKDKANFGSENLEDILVVNHRFDDLQIENDTAQVDEVEPNDTQVINAVGEFFVSLAAIDQKDAAVFMKGAGNPNREWKGDGEIECIRYENWIHEF